MALDLLAGIDMVGVLTPTLLRACMKAGQLVELVLTKPLIPIQLGMYTRFGSPLTAPAKSAAATISRIAIRIALTGELRSTSPLVVKQ